MALDFQSSTVTGPWSRDSQRIAVNRRTGGPAEVTVGSGKMRILATEMRTAHDWSPDGASLLGTGQDDHRLYAVSLTGETGTRTILDTPYRKRDFRFSPDGQWVAYSSDESGRFEVFVAAFPSFAKKRQMSNSGGSMPFWRKDGKEILYLSSDGTMMSVGIQLGSAIEVGAPKPLFQLQRGRFFDFSIAPTGDGERFLVIEREQAGPQDPTIVVLNWAAELKQ
jgi:Tol biopolymer transport system component